MARLGRQVAVCPRCPELVTSRTSPVFGVGKLQARALLVGEAPGHEEDRRGEPFVGQAGRLLNELLAEAGLVRGEMYLTNIIKCHPPKNRNPRPLEIANCLPYLEQQVALLQPRVICALGRIAACALTRTNRPLQQMRGRVDDYRGVPLVCTYHPAYVRRMPWLRTQAVDDLRRVAGMLKADGRP